MVSPVTDPALLQQLEQAAAGPVAAAPAGNPVDPITAKFLDQLSGQSPMPKTAGEYMKVPGVGMPIFQNPDQGPTPQQLSLVRGGRDFMDTWAQRLGRGVEAAAPYSMWNQIAPVAEMATVQRQKTEEANRQAEADYRLNWRPDIPAGGSDPYRTIGEMVPNAVAGSLIPGGAAASLLPRMASGAASGGLFAGEPNYNANVSGPDYWKDQGIGAGINAAIGGVAPAVTSAIARLVRPNTSPEIQTLMENGVRPTPGQMLGGTANQLEQAATSIPIVGDIVKTGRYGATQQFDRGAINQVLTQIGEKLEAPTLGREAIQEMGDKVSAAYNARVPNASMALPQSSAQDISQLRTMASFMPPDRATQFEKILQGKVLDKISPNGHMTGESFKEAESDLGKLASDYLYNHAATSDERQLGGAVRELQSTLRGWLQQANPASASEISSANAAYARMLRVENAASRSGAEPGLFSPAQLQAAAKKYATPRSYAQGTGLMQDYADAGRQVLGATLPDSGTPYRGMAALLGGSALGALAGEKFDSPAATKTALGIGGGALLAGGMYSPAGRAAIAHMLATRPEAATALARGLWSSGPAVAGAAPGLWGALTQ
jgi:hypothetical protein